MRASRAKRVDANQTEIVEALRRHGISVMIINGAVDIIAGGLAQVGSSYIRQNVLMEIKDGSKSPSKRKLTKDEKALHDGWGGDRIQVVNNPFEALKLFGIKPDNRIQCLNCKQIIESLHRHDYKQCKCGKVAVDGGSDYMKRTGEIGTWRELP